MVRGREQPPSWYATPRGDQALTAAAVSPRCWPPAAFRGRKGRPLSACSPCCYLGWDSLSSARSATTVSRGGRGSCGLAAFTGALMIVACGS